jgi:hypothetical protein
MEAMMQAPANIPKSHRHPVILSKAKLQRSSETIRGAARLSLSDFRTAPTAKKPLRST